MIDLISQSIAGFQFELYQLEIQETIYYRERKSHAKGQLRHLLYPSQENR